MKYVLRLEEVCVSIKGSEILHNVSLSVGEGEVVSLLGRNGAGKTTTMRTIMGFLKLDSGSIEFMGENISGYPPHKIARMGIAYSPEDSGVFDLSVEENIEMATWIRSISSKSPEERIKLAYSVFPVLEKYRKRKGTQLSGGERRMLSLARALAMDPKLCLFDEPFEGLSPAIIPTIEDSIQKIAKMGVSTLLAESNVYQVPEFADRVYVIERGEIIFEGKKEEILEDEKLMSIVAIC